MSEKGQISADVKLSVGSISATGNTSSVVEMQPCRQTKKVVGLAKPLCRQLAAEVETNECQTVEMQPCRQTKKVVGLAKPLCQRLSAEILADKYHQASVCRPTACATAADNMATEQSLVRVRHSVYIDSAIATVEDVEDISYSAEFDVSTAEAEVELYWNSVARTRWLVEATQYEVAQNMPTLQTQLKSLELLFERCQESKARYLTKHRIDCVEVTAMKAYKQISYRAYTYSEFVKQLEHTGYRIHDFFQACLEGSATKVVLAVISQEMLK